jgi:hypothetical protein
MRIGRLSDLQQFAAINLTLDLGAIAGPRHAPGCADITLFFNLTDGKVAHIVLTGRYAGAFHGTTAECNAISAALHAGTPWTTLTPFLATGTVFSGVTIHDINPTDGSGATAVPGAVTQPGTSTGIALPSEVAAVITKRTGFSGPQNRGRMYFPGWATTALGASDVIAPAAVTALGNWATTNVGSALSGSGYTHVLAQMARAAYTSPITGRDFPARDAGSIAITALQVRDNHWDSQRRRGLR